MLFNSAGFLIFFPVVVFLYFTTPHRFRWFLLLAASCYFYACFIPVYILLLLYMTCVDFAAGILIEKWALNLRLKKIIFTLSLGSSLGLLFFLKYFYFFNSNIAAWAHSLGLHYPVPSLKFILPLGISFHTFQSLSYIVEVYKGRQKAERHFGILMLFIMFFPQLAAGPIERASHMLPQFRKKHFFEYQRAADGLKLMAWGFFQKLVIADRLALYVNQVYAQPEAHSGLQLFAATLFFAFQVFCDFCGYTDIAAGSAQVLGFQLVRNFRQPYLAASPQDFWHRWHISLSTWFRDYVYVPLGGNRCGKIRQSFNLMITFLLSGLWHGANWTFVVWGGLHGFFLLISKWMQWLSVLPAKAQQASERAGALSIFGTFGLVCFAWIFFRAESLSDAFYIVSHLAGSGTDWRLSSLGKGIDFYAEDYFVALAAVTVLLSVHLLQDRGIRIREMVGRQPLIVRWSLYYGVVFSIWFWGATDVKPFIYFQF